MRKIEVHYKYCPRHRREGQSSVQFVVLTEKDLERAAYEKASFLREGARIDGDEIEFVRLEFA